MVVKKSPGTSRITIAVQIFIARRLQRSGKSAIIDTMKPNHSRIATIEVLYFARLREAFDRDREQVELPGNVRDVSTLTAWLRSRGAPWDSMPGAA